MCFFPIHGDVKRLKLMNEAVVEEDRALEGGLPS